MARRYCQEAVQSLLPSLGTYDAFDQVEVMCAARTMGVLEVTPGAAIGTLIEARLNQLPTEVANHLTRVGSLP